MWRTKNRGSRLDRCKNVSAFVVPDNFLRTSFIFFIWLISFTLNNCSIELRLRLRRVEGGALLGARILVSSTPLKEAWKHVTNIAIGLWATPIGFGHSFLSFALQNKVWSPFPLEYQNKMIDMIRVQVGHTCNTVFLNFDFVVQLPMNRYNFDPGPSSLQTSL